jgi:hypothetical protein
MIVPLVPPLLASFTLPVVAAGAAAAAVAVPVLIHLFNRQRVRIVDWAAVRFLLAAQKRRHRRIDEWLLLAARVAVLLLLLAGMAAVTPWAEALWQRIKPGDPETILNAPRTHHILVLDATYSLSARPGQESRFETALRLAEQAVRQANPGDGFSLVVLASPPQAVVPGPSSEPDKVIAEIAALKQTHGTTDTTAGLGLIANLLAQSPRAYPRRQVLFFSDLQRSAWGPTLPQADDSPPEVWQRIVNRADVAFVDVAGTDLENLAVTNIALADPLPLVESPAAVVATVHNFGRTDRRLVRVELLIGRPEAGGQDHTLFPVEQRIIESIPAAGQTAITFTLDGAARFREPGVHLIQVKLTESDDLPIDDARSIAVEVRDGLPCLLVNGKPSIDPLRRASEYLAEALAPGGRIIPGNPARPRVISLEEFADPSLSDLSNVDCVFLCDLPSITPSQVARLEGLLKRGGGVVIGLGPNAAANADLYNKLLYAEGQGLLPGRITGVKVTASADDPGFRLAAEEGAYRLPPLAAFQDENSRGGLTAVPFHQYVTLDTSDDERARRVLSFVPAAANPADTDTKPDPAVIETPRHRGRVVVYTSTFNTEWTDWPRLPSFLPFAHELLRFAATNQDRHTLRVGDPLEEYVPVSLIGLSATVNGPGGLAVNVPVMTGDETGLIRFPDTLLAGVYRVLVPGLPTRLFAVNVPESSPGGGSESDLRRLDPSDFGFVSPAIQVVSDPADVTLTTDEDGIAVTTPRPHGPTIARWLITLAVVLLVAEAVLAWRLGPGRSTIGIRSDASEAGWSTSRFAIRAISLVPFVAAGAILLAVLHADQTGDLLGFLPENWRKRAEAAVGVPDAAAGEGTRWRLESTPVFAPTFLTDRWLLTGLTVAAILIALAAYRAERRGVSNGRTLVLPFALRAIALLFIIWVVLPQLRLAFDREGWPDVAILIDTSGSMSVVDDLQDPEVRQKAEELKAIAGTSEANRLLLAQTLLTRPDGDWLTRLLTGRQVKVHIYSLDEQAKLIASLDEPDAADTGRKAIAALIPDGQASRLGDGVQAVLKSFRGGSLTALIVFTDGITTDGDDLPAAGRAAARAGVPLYLVGVGDAKDPLDLALGDLRAEDVVAKDDELVFEARLTAKGPNVPRTVVVTLYEKQGESRLKRAETTIIPDPTGKPVPVRLQHVPTEVGEKTFIIEVPPAPGESEIVNNRIERTVVVTDNKRLRVLYVEGYPRYEFRYVKVLLERELEAGRPIRSFDLNSLLLDASRDYPSTDRTALRGFPTRNELFEYDVVILGDVDPSQFPRPKQTFQDLADFVRQRGGGLLVIAGEQSVPHKLFDTPLADVLPVMPADGQTGPPKPSSERDPIRNGYRMRLTPTGVGHPLFRFAAEDADSARIWSRLQPLLWYATGYKRKDAAEVLAVHPDRLAEGQSGENHPLVVQQFAGSGRVVFFGFDESWRWRFRQDEEQFNRFWRQAVRVLARNRISRAELRTDKQTPYRRDEPITVTARFPDDAPPPPADGVKVIVDRLPSAAVPTAEPETQRMTLTKVEGTRATFQGMLTRTPEGEYRFRLVEPEVPGSRPTAKATVLPPPGEMDRLEVNRSDLLRAAAESRGKAYTLADADTLLDELPEGVRVALNQPCPPVPVWNHLATFGLIVTLLGAEWIIRRRERLL